MKADTRDANPSRSTAHDGEGESNYAVGFKVWPHIEMLPTGREQTGFDIELGATHVNDSGHLNPECMRCRALRVSLAALGRRLYSELPADLAEKVALEVDEQESSIELSVKYPTRPFVSVTVTVLHKNNRLLPVDSYQVNAVAEIRKRLGELHIPER